MVGIDFNEPPFDIESGRYNWDVFHASPHARAKEKMLRHALKVASLATGAGAAGILYKAKSAYDRFIQRAAEKRQRQSQIPEFYEKRRKRTIYPDYVPLETPGYCENNSRQNNSEASVTFLTRDEENMSSGGLNTNGGITTCRLSFPSKSCSLSRADRMSCAVTPAFQGRRRFKDENTVTGGKQTVYYNRLFTHTELKEFWRAGCCAHAKQSIVGSTTTQNDNTLLPYNTDLDAELDYNQANGGVKFKQVKMLVYRRSVEHYFQNQCNMNLEFCMYFIKTKRALPRNSAGNTYNHPQSLTDLMDKIFNDTGGGADEMYGSGSAPNVGGVTNWNRRDIGDPGVDPTNQSYFRRYYTCQRKKKFCLRPGEAIKIQCSYPACKLFNGYSYVDYAEYPGICINMMYTVNGQLVGDSTANSNTVSTSSGKFIHLTTYYATVKVFETCKNFKGDYSGSGFTTITDANQMAISEETDATKTYTKETN